MERHAVSLRQLSVCCFVARVVVENSPACTAAVVAIDQCARIDAAI